MKRYIGIPRVDSKGVSMKTAYVAVVRLLLDVDSAAEGCDGITALLTENMAKYNANSCLLDWQYEGVVGTQHAPTPVAINNDYSPDVDSVPAWKKPKKIHSLGIDVLTASKDKVITRLKALKSTVSVSDGGVYDEDSDYIRVHIETTRSWGWLDDWMWGEFVQHTDYVTVFERKGEQ